jgi:hypothetical protein
MKTFIHDLATFMSGTLCQICYKPMQILDANGSWCARCHKEFTDGIVYPNKRISVIDLMKKYRKDYDTYPDDEKKK